MALLCRPRQLPRAQLVPVVGDPRVYQLAKTRFRPALQGLLDPMNHLWDLPQVAPVITSRRLAERAAAGRKAQVRRRCSGADPPLRKSGGATGPFPLSGATTGTRYPVRHYQVHNRIWEKELLRVPVPGTVPGYPYLVVRIIRCSRWPGMAGPVTSQGTWYPGTRAHFLVPPMGCGSTVPGYR